MIHTRIAFANMFSKLSLGIYAFNVAVENCVGVKIVGTNCQYDSCKSTEHKLICTLCFHNKIAHAIPSHKLCHLFSFAMRAIRNNDISISIETFQ